MGARLEIPGQDGESYRVQLIELIMSLRSHGITDTNILSAMEKVPRHLFINKAFGDQAYADHALPIECGQTISQPFIVAYMTTKLELGERHKVLEIGTGSGYQTAVLSHLARRVYTIERYRTLMSDAEARFKDLRRTNITTMVGDGIKGWPAQAPFDRIIVTAAGETMPEALIDQLKDDGIMVIPVGRRGEIQRIVKVKKQSGEVLCEELLQVRFVPLVPGKAQQL